MSKLPLYIFLFFSVSTMWGCYEPVEGCLDIDAVNYSVNADDPCANCCVFPVLTLGLQHRVEWVRDSVTMTYGTFYPNANTPNTDDFFMIDRARYFLSNIKLVKEDETEVEVIDQLELTFDNGEMQTVTNSFAILDTEDFGSVQIGTVKTEGTFKEVRFTLGLDEFLLGREITSGPPSGHPLDASSDTISYESGTGFIPNLLIMRYDTLLSQRVDEFRFFEPISIVLPFEQPLVLEKGNNIKLTLRTNYMDWFVGVDFENDSFQTIAEKIEINLPNVFSVTEITAN